jgi:hypothetical protein
LSTHQKEELILLLKAFSAAFVATFVHMFTVNVLNVHPWVLLLCIGAVLFVVFVKFVPKLTPFAITYFITSVVWTVVYF